MARDDSRPEATSREEALPRWAPPDEGWPTEIRLAADKRVLHVAFGTTAYALPAEYLRVESPSAEVQGHGPAEKQVVPGKRLVAVRAIEPVGNYAVRLVFDDGHDTGLYTWPYLATLGREQEERFAAYRAALAARGLSREP